MCIYLFLEINPLQLPNVGCNPLPRILFSEKKKSCDSSRGYFIKKIQHRIESNSDVLTYILGRYSNGKYFFVLWTLRIVPVWLQLLIFCVNLEHYYPRSIMLP